MPAHPLALELIRRLRPSSRVLEIGSGRGRNTQALREAGLRIVTIADEAAAATAAFSVPGGSFDAALSTHALLHGTLQSVGDRIAAIAHLLATNALFCATFGSKNDARFGKGVRVAENTFAPSDGDERSVAHVYYDETRLRSALVPYFQIESVEEREVDKVAGRWAHPSAPLRGAVHWFVIARCR